MTKPESVDCQGKVFESDPPRQLSMTWHVEWMEEFRRLTPLSAVCR